MEKWNKINHSNIDAGAHGTEFTPGDKYTSEGPKLVNLIQRLAKNIIKIISFKIGSESNNSFLTFEKYYKSFEGALFKTYDFQANGSIENVSAHFERFSYRNCYSSST